jgi:hypothetical protein
MEAFLLTLATNLLALLLRYALAWLGRALHG